MDLLGVGQPEQIVKTQRGKAANPRRSSLNPGGEEGQKTGRKVTITAKDDKKEEVRQELELVVHSNSPKNIEQEVTIVSDEFGLAMYG